MTGSGKASTKSTPAELSALPVVDLPIDLIDPNGYNPNRQSPRQFDAEVESILTFGFVAPVLVRANPDEPGRWQIVDGEHRWRALHLLQDVELSADAPEQLRDVLARRILPAVVLELDDDAAKKLTVVMNETRGRPDQAALGQLLAELASHAPLDQVQIALPYAQDELADLIKLGSFDWSALGAPDEGDLDPQDGEPRKPEPGNEAVVHYLTITPDVLPEWRRLVELLRVPLELPEDESAAESDALLWLIANGLEMLSQEEPA